MKRHGGAADRHGKTDRQTNEQRGKERETGRQAKKDTKTEWKKMGVSSNKRGNIKERQKIMLRP